MPSARQDEDTAPAGRPPRPQAGSRGCLPIADWSARLALTPSGHSRITYVDPDGATHDRLPHAVRARAVKAELAAIQTRRNDLEAVLREARGRLEASFRNGRDWSAVDWQQRYQVQPVTRTLASRLLWLFTPDDSDAPFVALGTAPCLTLLDGREIACPQTGRVRLWHPVVGNEEERLAWRAAVQARGVRQPFSQVWRPVYRLTDPELRTATYSNRFAGFLLDQKVFVAVLRRRGWVLRSRFETDSFCGSGTGDYTATPARLALEGAGLVAEYWGVGRGRAERHGAFGAPNFPYFGSTQLRFYRAGEDSWQGARPVPLSSVPPLAFCEAMFDIDLTTGLSVQGFDAAWRDPGPDALPPPPEAVAAAALETGWSGDAMRQPASELARMRIELLGWLQPRLTFGTRLRVLGHVLRVTGKWHEYDIHAGNAAVRIVGPNQHVCIVPRPAAKDGAGDTGVGFAGDEVLAIILSKAAMLMDEEAIDDPAIVRQLRGTSATLQVR